MKAPVVRGSTSNIVRVFIPDNTSTTGAGLTGLTYSSTKLRIAVIRGLASAATVYAQSASTIETITTIGTYAAPTATKCRFKAVDATNFPGVYEIQFADAIFDASDASRFLTVVVNEESTTALHIGPCLTEIPLTAVDPQDGVHYGLTCLPNTAVTTNGSLITMGTGTAQLSCAGGRGKADVTYWSANPVQTPDASGYPICTIKDGTGQGELNLDTGRVDANVTYWKGSAAGDTATVASIWSNGTRTLTAPTNITSTDGKIALGAEAVGGGYGVMIATDTQALPGVSIGSVTGAVGSVTGGVTVTTNSDKTGYSGTVTDKTGFALSTAGNTAVATAILATPANKLATDSSGRVTPRLERITRAAALSNFEFLMVDSSDHSTPKTSLTVSATASIDGAAFASLPSGNTATEVGSGIYKIDLSANDTDGVVITLKFTAAGADARYITLITQAQ
jgi:hypothetical protein